MNDTTSETPEKVAPTPLVSAEAFSQCLLLTNIAIFIFSVMGVVTNAINIRVFMAMGVVSDSTTVSLFALAICDLLSCFFTIPMCLCFERYHRFSSDNLFLKNCYVLIRLPTVYPHIIFSRVTCWVTVYLSVERALCVVLPLKIKSIFTPKRSTFAMSTIYLVIILSHLPYYATRDNFVVWVFDPLTNSTSIATSPDTAVGKVMVQFSNLIFSAILTTVAMGIVIIATLIMFSRLKASTKWRESHSAAVTSTKNDSSTSSSQQSFSSSSSSSKEKEMMKIVATVTSVYIICTAVSLIPGFGTYVVPGMSYAGYNQNLFHLLFGFKYLSDVVNSSVNMFFYVKMSTKYRVQFYALFFSSQKQKKKELK